MKYTDDALSEISKNIDKIEDSLAISQKARTTTRSHVRDIRKRISSLRSHVRENDSVLKRLGMLPPATEEPRGHNIWSATPAP